MATDQKQLRALYRSLTAQQTLLDRGEGLVVYEPQLRVILDEVTRLQALDSTLVPTVSDDRREKGSHGSMSTGPTDRQHPTFEDGTDSAGNDVGCSQRQGDPEEDETSGAEQQRAEPDRLALRQGRDGPERDRHLKDRHGVREEVMRVEQVV